MGQFPLKTPVRGRHPNHDPVIGWDATYAVGRHLSGVGRYSLELMTALAALPQPFAYRRYYRPHRWLRAPFPKRLLLDHCPRSLSLFHGLNQRLPVPRRDIPMLATFHDLFVLSGEYSTPDFRTRFAAQAREAASRASLLIAVSAFTAQQCADLLAFPRERIHVVPHGVHLPPAVTPPHQRQPLVLSVGAIQKRKNTRRLIEAFRVMPAPWQLLIAGSAGFEADQLPSPLPSNVRLLGYVSDAELAALYQQAAILAFPSLDEGFGIPLLEAMANGLAILTSPVSAMPEVAGPAALYADPHSTDALAAALLELTSLDRRLPLIAAGLARAPQFSWAHAAQLTAAAYSAALAA